MKTLVTALAALWFLLSLSALWTSGQVAIIREQIAPQQEQDEEPAADEEEPAGNDQDADESEDDEPYFPEDYIGNC